MGSIRVQPKRRRSTSPSYLMDCPRCGPGPLAGTFTIPQLEGPDIVEELTFRTVGDPINEFVKERQTGTIVCMRCEDKATLSREPSFLKSLKTRKFKLRVF